MAQEQHRPRLEAAGLPPSLLPLLWLLIFVAMMDGRVISTVLPQLADDLGVTVATVALTLTAYALPYGICQLAYGPLADRVGAMRVIAVASIIFALVVAAGAMAPNLATLLVARLLAGGVAAAFFPLALATVGNLVPYHQRQGAIAGLLAAVAGGQVMGAALGGLMAQVASWRAMFVIDSLLVVLLILPVWRARRATPPDPSLPADPFRAHRHLLSDRRALTLYAIVGIEGLLYWGALGYLAALLRDRDGLGLLAIGLLLTLDGLATMLASRVVAPLMRRIGEDRLMLAGGLLMGGSFLLALLLPDWRILALAVTAMGAGFPFFHSTLQTRATELIPTARGTAISLFAFSLFMGSGLGTAFFGLLLTIAGYNAILLTAGLGLTGLGLIAPGLTRHRHDRDVTGISTGAPAASGPE